MTYPQVKRERVKKVKLEGDLIVVEDNQGTHYRIITKYYHKGLVYRHDLSAYGENLGHKGSDEVKNRMIRIYFNVGIITQEEKNSLMSVLGEKDFERRKEYSEFYVSPSEIRVDISLQWLMKLSDQFVITINFDGVTITTYDNR